MANYTNLLATIAANIYTNHNNEVTAAMVKSAVDAMVASLGAGYQFIDVATPATNPGTPDQKVFYLASEPGTYTNFGGIVVNDGEIAALYGSGSSWSKVTTNASLLNRVATIEANLYTNIGGKNILSGTSSSAFTETGLLKQTGVIDTSQTNYITTDYTKIPAGTNVIRWAALFPAVGGNAGLNLYDQDKTFIATVNGSTYDSTGNSGAIDMADYPTAVYFRASTLYTNVNLYFVYCEVEDVAPLADKIDGVTITTITAPTGVATWEGNHLLDNMGQIGVNFIASGEIFMGLRDATDNVWLIPPRVWDGWKYVAIPAGHYIRIYALSNEATSLSVNVKVVRDSSALQVAADVADPENKLFEVGTGKAFSTIRQAISSAYNIKDAKVVVYPGTYDLLTEFAAEIAAHSGGTKGNLLGNGMHVLFLPGAYVTANYELENDNAKDSWVYNYFNPFYTDGSDFLLEGANIEAKNTRYCVHDECAGVGTYVHKFLNCRMKYVSDNPAGTYVQAIGGGLGEHGYIEIVGGYFSSTPTPGGPEIGISYHNGNNSNADSAIFIRDVYVAGGGNIRFSAYGSSPIASRAYVSNCSLGAAVENLPYAGSTDFDLTEWNNTIR